MAGIAHGIVSEGYFASQLLYTWLLASGVNRLIPRVAPRPATDNQSDWWYKGRVGGGAMVRVNVRACNSV